MADKTHKISLSFLVDKLNKQFGGTAGNIAYNLKLLGIDPFILSAAGNDFSQYDDFLKENLIETKYIKRVTDEITGSYFVVTDMEDNQIGSFYVGATKHAQDLDIPKKLSEFAIISATTPDAMRKAVAQSIDQHIKFMYDPAFQIGSLSREDLKAGIDACQIFIGNDYEIALVERKFNIDHQELVNMVPILITTLGASGSIVEAENKKIEIKPAMVSEVLDPTGAGDAFRGGFMAGYFRGFDLRTCGQMGSVSAAYTVEKYGTMTHDYAPNEFLTRYNQNYSNNLNL
jgi:adenosine kinase